MFRPWLLFPGRANGGRERHERDVPASIRWPDERRIGDGNVADAGGSLFARVRRDSALARFPRAERLS